MSVLAQSSARRSIEAPAAGFTLIEVLLALAIFSIGLLAIAGMQTSSVNKNTSARMSTMAVEYGADYMERLLGLGTAVNLARDNVDNDGDGETDEKDEGLGYPQLADGGPHEPEDFAGVDYDGDGVDDIIAHQSFGEIFDLSWTVADAGSGSAAFDPGGALDEEGAAKLITLTVRWGRGGDKQVVLRGIKTTA